MGILELLGRKRENQAMAFVDYEHWFFSLREKFGVKPDVLAWAKEVRDQYDISQMLFFGNFLQGILQDEVTRVLTVTNGIVETQFGNPGYRIKDMSDFILLDHLYRASEDRRSPQTFLLFTGGGHFAPVVRHFGPREEKDGHRLRHSGLRQPLSQGECHGVPGDPRRGRGAAALQAADRRLL